METSPKSLTRKDTKIKSKVVPVLN
jgi:hypothetical protein